MAGGSSGKPRVRVGTDGSIRGFAPPAGLPALSGTRRTSQFMRGEQASIFSSWWPMLRDPREDVRSAYWLATARTIEFIHNSGWLAGLVQQGKASILGEDGLQLAPKPDFATLGWTQDVAKTWSALVKAKFEAWAANPLECDAAGKCTLHQQARAGIGSYYGAGEIVALLRWIERPQSRTRTKVQLVPAHRLTQESDGIAIFQGVRIDGNGLPLSYRMRLPMPILESGEVLEIRARDGQNRPIVVHIFDGEIGQMRGLSPFTPVLQRARQFDLITNGNLTAELQRTLVAATITSEKPTREVLQAFQSLEEQGTDGGLEGMLAARGDWYDNTSFDLNGPVKIVHLFPGEKLDLKTGAEMTSVFEPQAQMLLREIAACAGHTVEEMTGNYNGVTYTGARISTTVRWPIMLQRRKQIATPLYHASYGAWLEESIDSDAVPFPGGLEAFVANREAACRAVWRGPAKPQADDLKYAKASETLKRMGVVTDERLCAEMGEDWEDVYHQLAEEKARRQLLGLPEPLLSGSTVIDEDELEEEETGGDAGSGEDGGQSR